MVSLLLVNLGTPDAPTPSAVRRYLRQFLSDPRVLDMNAVGRTLLLEGVILPTRPAKSAAAYAKIWGERGSPLLYHSQDLVAAVQARLGGEWHVELAMRYGQPSIGGALERLQGHDHVVVLPLYPQYSSAATGSTVEEVCRLAAPRWVTPVLSFVGAFYDDAGFLDAFAAVAREHIAGADHVLFSYHGLPERQVTRCDESGAHCLRAPTCCDAIVAANRHCYRAQCYATTRALVARLGLQADRHSVAFQSRLGRTPWIQPHTDVVLPELVRAGAKKIAVMCPAFVADCLETLEEIGIRAQESVAALGGSVTLVPSLNATPAWADAVAAMARRHAPH